MEESLRAGIAVYNAGAYHAAHDAWEDHWLELPEGTDDEQLLHGLIQYTAAVYHAHNRNWSGAVGLAGSSRQYLDGLAQQYRSVDLRAVRAYLRALEVDPERIERAAPAPLYYTGQLLTARDLDVGGITTAAKIVAEDIETYDHTLIESATEYAHEEVDSAETTFIRLLATFVDDAAHRGIVYNRLVSQLERRQQKQQDVAGLFEPRDNY